MKKIAIILAMFGLLLSFGGCKKYLDSDYLFDERMTMEDVFTNRDYTERWLARAYYFLGTNAMQDVSSKKSVMFNFADDMYYGDENEEYAKWKRGQYTENGLSGENKGIWKTAYDGIRQASIFIHNIHLNQDISDYEKEDMKAQAKFLRAYFYWVLMRNFGPVPLMPDEGVDYTESYDQLALPRSTYDECTEFVAKELADAAPSLPLTRGNTHLARPVRGAALALRARVLLFAASPLYNGKAPADVAAALITKQGKRLLSDAYDESKWARAAAAAKDVIDLGKYQLYVAYRKESGNAIYPATVTPPYDSNFSDVNWPLGWRDIDPYESYRALFNGDVAATQNPELIFTRGQNQGSENIRVMVLHQLPRTEAVGGYNSHGMTQKQADAYYMNNGEDLPGMNVMYQGRQGYTGRYNTQPRPSGVVSPAEDQERKYPELGVKGVGVHKQYVRREPRFYASVAYNGSVWNLDNITDPELLSHKNRQIFYYFDSTSGYRSGVTYWLRTGIGVKKYVHPNDYRTGTSTGYDFSNIEQKVDPAIRYAEVLLAYAEALNELSGSHSIASYDGAKTHTIMRDLSEIKKGIQPIRIRAGLPDYSTDVYNDVDKFRLKLKRERQIELFAEGHRFYDLRRWTDAPNEEAAPIYGNNVLVTSNNPEVFHTPVAIPSLPTIFSLKMWFWPIHWDELRSNKELTQNPGWTYPE